MRLDREGNARCTDLERDHDTVPVARWRDDEAEVGRTLLDELTVPGVRFQVQRGR